MGKYIIEVGDAYTKHICGKGDMLCLPVRINEFEDNWLNTNIPLTPYTEPDIEKAREEEYEKGYQDATAKISSDEQAIAEKAYQSGLNDAWKAARKIACAGAHGGYHIDTKIHIFGAADYSYILANYNASEAIEKIRQYEQEKEQQIQVGDEVISPDGKGVVTEISDRTARIMFSSGLGYMVKSEDLTKTGRHFPEIAAVLEKMRGEKDG